MPRPPVFVKATFVSTRAGKSPTVYIERPEDISELLGELTCKGFEQLKEKLTALVDNGDNGLFFHKDNLHIYRFNESALPGGGIYGLKEKRALAGDISKLTASKLVPIQSPLEFERNVTLTGMV